MFFGVQVNCPKCIGTGRKTSSSSRTIYNYFTERYEYVYQTKTVQCEYCKGTGLDNQKTEKNKQRKRVREQQQRRKIYQRRKELLKTKEGRKQLERQRQQRQESDRRYHEEAKAMQKQYQEQKKRKRQQQIKYLMTPQGKKQQQKLLNKIESQTNKIESQTNWLSCKLSCKQLCNNIIYFGGQRKQWKQAIWVIILVLLFGLLWFAF